MLTIPAAFAMNWGIGRVAMEYFRNPGMPAEQLKEKNKKNNPGNREPGLVTEGDRGSTTRRNRGVGDGGLRVTAGGDEYGGHTGGTTAAVGVRRRWHHIAKSNWGGAVAGGSTREVSAMPDSVRRASACLRVECTARIERRPPQGQHNTSVPKVL